MTVGVFCPTFNVYGGAEFVAFCVSNSLAERGYLVRLFVNRDINQRTTGKFFGKELHSSIKTIVRSNPLFPRGLPDFYQTIVSSFVFRKRCDFWIDVYSNCIYPWTEISYIHFPFLNFEYFSNMFPYVKIKHALQLGAIPYVFLEKNMADYNGKLIIANSYYTADEIERFSGKQVPVLYPPVSSTVFKNQDGNSPTQRDDIVITISRFSRGKGLEKVPYIASLTDRDVKFVVVGRLHDRYFFRELQRIVEKSDLQNRVKLLTDVSKEMIRELLRHSKIYLHAMSGEHFGISIVEAMAMGCIPVVHDSGGAKEFVPPDLRYRGVSEAAEIINNNIYGWSAKRSQEIKTIAERFEEGVFSSRFVQIFEEYLDRNRTLRHRLTS